MGGTDDLPAIQDLPGLSQSYTTSNRGYINGTYEEETPEEEGQGGLLNEAHTSPGLQGSTSGDST